jgi:hypothetical protein
LSSEYVSNRARKQKRNRQLNDLRKRALCQGGYMLSVIYRVLQDLGEDHRLDPGTHIDWINLGMTLGMAHDEFQKIIAEVYGSFISGRMP